MTRKRTDVAVHAVDLVSGLRLVVDRERVVSGVTYGVTSPDAPGCFGVGRTRAIAVRRFREAVAELRAYELGQRGK